jgi:hypothetical protein
VVCNLTFPVSELNAAYLTPYLVFEKKNLGVCSPGKLLLDPPFPGFAQVPEVPTEVAFRKLR